MLIMSLDCIMVMLRSETLMYINTSYPKGKGKEIIDTQLHSDLPCFFFIITKESHFVSRTFFVTNSYETSVDGPSEMS